MANLMPDAQPTTDQFWLLTGDVPSGPFTVAQVHAKLATGDATWQTPACAVGGGQWLPLLQTPGIGPSGPPVSGGVGQRSSEASPQPARNTSPATQNAPPAAVKGSPPHDDDGRPQPVAEPNSAGPGQPGQSNRFWLQVGTDTTGPFRVADIRYRVQTGEIPTDAKARRVGTDEWVSLTDAVGSLPPLHAKPKAPPAGRPVAAEQPASRRSVAEPEPPGGGVSKTVEVRCGCGRLVHAERAYVGQSVQCPHCNGSVAVPVATAAATSPAKPAPSEPWLDPKSQQAVHVILGLVLTAAFFGFIRGCKEDAAEQRKNQPPLRDYINKSQDKNR